MSLELLRPRFAPDANSGFMRDYLACLLPVPTIMSQPKGL